MSSNTFDRLSFLSLFLVVVLLPVFCLPFTNIPIETSKGLLLVVGLTVCVIFWAIARFFDGRITFPKSKLLVAGIAIAAVALVSALLSKSVQASMFGNMFDVGTFWYLFAGILLMLCAATVFRTPKQAKTLLLGAILSSAFVLIFQTLHIFVPKALSLGLLAGKTSNVLGSWNALGLFAGFSSLMFLMVLEFFPISKMEKLLLQIFLVLSILVSAAVNFQLVWILLGVSSLIIFVYKISINSHGNREEGGEKQHNFPLASFVVVMVTLLFFMSGQFIGGVIPNKLQLTSTEISPSLSSTLTVTKGVIKQSPVLGLGPNKFGEAWAMFKPESINSTLFWDVSFESGSGLLPTLLATAGILGILAWLAFFVLFLVAGVRSLFSSIKNGVNWERTAFFVLSLYLFVASFFYFSGSVMFLLSLAFVGVFVGLSSARNPEEEFSMSFLSDHRKSFFSIMALIVLIIVSAATSFKFLERFASVSYFNKALTASSVPIAQDAIGKALALHTNDLYLRTYSQIYLIKLNSIATKGGTLSDADKADLQATVDQVVRSAQLAVAYNPKNYLNHKLLGSVYQTLGSIGVKDMFGKALESFQNASALNPLNPGIKLSLAGAAFANGDTKGAIDYAKQALALKPDYVDALVTLSQLAKSQGDNAGALSYAEQALAISPTNKDLIKYVDSLRSGNSNAPVPASVTPLPTTKKK